MGKKIEKCLNIYLLPSSITNASLAQQAARKSRNQIQREGGEFDPYTEFVFSFLFFFLFLKQNCLPQTMIRYTAKSFILLAVK